MYRNNNLKMYKLWQFKMAILLVRLSLKDSTLTVAGLRNKKKILMLQLMV